MKKKKPKLKTAEIDPVTKAFIRFIDKGLGTDQVKFSSLVNQLKPMDSDDIRESIHQSVVENTFTIEESPDSLKLIIVGFLRAAGKSKEEVSDGTNAFMDELLFWLFENKEGFEPNTGTKLIS